jgi:Secretion system C-terminal sorting domain
MNRISIPNEWQNKKVTYEILNANGQVTQKTEVAGSSQTETINTTNLARGFYVVRVSCGNQFAQQKIVKQ